MDNKMKPLVPLKNPGSTKFNDDRDWSNKMNDTYKQVVPQNAPKKADEKRDERTTKTGPLYSDWAMI